MLLLKTMMNTSNWTGSNYVGCAFGSVRWLCHLLWLTQSPSFDYAINTIL